VSNYIRGVNFGGWLILEKWITPALFSGFTGEDEYSFMKNAGATQRIEQHRKTFITEKDFRWLSANSINLVRIPVGYWLFKATDGHTPTVKYLDLAMQWAEKYGIHVLIDMHGAPGSQNGQNHSGRLGEAHWFRATKHQQDTAKLLYKIANRYKNLRALWGIELLNEPEAMKNYFKLLRFYRHTYSELRKILNPGTKIVYHDGFHALLFSGALWPHKSHPVVMDIHWYAFHPFGSSAPRYRKLLSLYRTAILRLVRLFQPVIIGEWSSVFPGRYFDQIPNDQHNELLKRNIDMQLSMFQHADGWIYWNYKHEGPGMWNFRSLVELGLFELPCKKGK